MTESKRTIPVFRPSGLSDAAVRLAVSYAQEHFDTRLAENQPNDPDALDDEFRYFLEKYSDEWTLLLEGALNDSVSDHLSRRGWDD